MYDVIFELEMLFNTESEKIIKPIPKSNSGLRRTKRINGKRVKNPTRRRNRQLNRLVQAC